MTATDLNRLDELNYLLARLDALDDLTDPDDYWTTRDDAIELVDRYPELTDVGRDYGLPV